MCLSGSRAVSYKTKVFIMKLKVEENIRFLKKLLFTTPTSKSVAIFERDFSGVVGYVTS